MARHKGLIGSIAQVRRETERRRNEQLRAQAQVMRASIAAERAAEQARRAYERAQKSDARERQRLYIESRKADVNLKNEELQATICNLGNILKNALSVNYQIDLDTLKQEFSFPEFNAGTLAHPEPPPLWEQFCPPAPTGIAKLLPNAKNQHLQAVTIAQQQFQVAVATHVAREAQRQTDLQNAWNAHLWNVHEVRVAMEEQHEEIDRFKHDLNAGFDEAVIDYFAMVFESGTYPAGFDTELELDYVASAKQLLIDQDLPPIDLVSETTKYKYVQSRDEITETKRPPTQRRALYSSILAKAILRTLYEVFQSDSYLCADSVIFNGYITALDQATGHPRRVCIASLTTTRDAFIQINLDLVDPIACLTRLNASFSRNPAIGEPVQPKLPTHQITQRTESHGQTSRLDLMMLTPIEFEQLIASLFQSMGLETRLTQASHDGGIDCIAYDSRPVLGGELVIQAKRYKNTVGVSVVRDLFGAVQDRRSSKGILVTTSGYGSDSYKFAADKPLELIDGKNLLSLLSTHMGIDAIISLS